MNSSIQLLNKDDTKKSGTHERIYEDDFTFREVPMDFPMEKGRKTY